MDFLPEYGQKSSAAAPSSPSSSIWADEETAMARQASIRRHLEHGWAQDPTGSLLVKGTGQSKVEIRPTHLMPSKSGDPDFNPTTDAFALRLGAEFVGPNRYRLPGGLLIDGNGAFRNDKDITNPNGDCPECGSSPLVVSSSGEILGGGEYRFRVAKEPPNPAKPWEMAWTYCRRCVSEDELAEVRRRMDAAPPAPRRHRDGAH
jgi:hypothetical protein